MAGGEHPYRTPPDAPVDIRPVRRLQARLVLAAIIVAPVRLIEWCWPWLVVNLIVAGSGFLTLQKPIVVGVVTLTLNSVTGIGYGAYRAYGWAVRELEASEKRSAEK